jgi:hypothetical protein
MASPHDKWQILDEICNWSLTEQLNGAVCKTAFGGRVTHRDLHFHKCHSSNRQDACLPNRRSRGSTGMALHFPTECQRGRQVRRPCKSEHAGATPVAGSNIQCPRSPTVEAARRERVQCRCESCRGYQFHPTRSTPAQNERPSCRAWLRVGSFHGKSQSDDSAPQAHFRTVHTRGCKV